MTRIRLIALGLILLLAFGVIFCVKQWRAAEQRADIEHSNYIAAAAENSEQVREFTMSKKQFELVHAEQAAKIKEQGYELKRVKGFHSIEYRWSRDTILQHDTVYVSADGFNNEMHWQYEQNCLSADITYMTSSGELAMKLNGELPISITTILDRPKHWFIKFKWDADKWPVRTIVDNPCGMTIKENVRFKIE